ncbi:MAG: ShlB/FhaC/HecB family hemolysin secretion/activation protein [Leptolyngbyaceae cyanobacterium SM1_1_3]|nr:ShlB/FhaC/HecB family hemolysin secretion/activation protein [Leptolyngbyaceae cyanobacterium SM1_1_3]
MAKTFLNVRVQESNPLVAQFSFDNFSPDSVGSERLGAEVSYLSPLGIGDQVFASAYISTTGGSEVYEIGYRVPLNALNGTLQLRFVPSSFEITDSSANFGLDIKGDADVYDVSFRQPLIRSLREELALSLGFRRREGQTLISDIVFDSSRTSILQFGQDYLRRDATGAWALRSQFNIGTDLFGVTQRSGDQPDGDFLSWVGQVQRIEILNDRHTLIVQGDLQLSGDPLLPSEQFIVGGGQSLRGYEQNSLFGDSGFRLSIEDRITLEANALGQPRLQVAPFLDMGAVWNNESGQTGRNEDFLVGLGTGLIWQPLPGLNMRLDLAVPLVSDGNEQGFFFNITYRP